MNSQIQLEAVQSAIILHMHLNISSHRIANISNNTPESIHTQTEHCIHNKQQEIQQKKQQKWKIWLLLVLSSKNCCDNRLCYKFDFQAFQLPHQFATNYFRN